MNVTSNSFQIQNNSNNEDEMEEELHTFSIPTFATNTLQVANLYESAKRALKEIYLVKTSKSPSDITGIAIFPETH